MISFTCMLREALEKHGLALCDDTKLRAGYGGEAELIGEELVAACCKLANEIRERLVAQGVVMTVKLGEPERP